MCPLVVVGRQTLVRGCRFDIATLGPAAVARIGRVEEIVVPFETTLGRPAVGGVNRSEE
jgi:acyl CoA:acetate/3-ketoacid CoA transferase beta subunit